MLVGVDPDPSQCTAFERSTGIATCNSLDSALQMHPDIVSIASPTEFHASHLEQCLQAQVKMIWLEKPISPVLEDSEKLLALQASLGRSAVMVGYQRRYLPVYIRLKQLIQSAALGHCTGISLVYSRGLLTNGVHLLDLLDYLLNGEQPEAVVALPGSSDESNPSFLLSYASGLVCTALGQNIETHSIDVSLHGSAGRAQVLHGGLSERREQQVDNPLYAGFSRLDWVTEGVLSSQVLSDQSAVVMPRLLDDLITAHELGRQPLSNLSTAMSAQHLVDRIFSATAERYDSDQLRAA